MHTCIFGGGIVRDEDGAVVPMVGAGYARRSPSPLPTERALSSFGGEFGGWPNLPAAVWCRSQGFRG